MFLGTGVGTGRGSRGWGGGGGLKGWRGCGYWIQELGPLNKIRGLKMGRVKKQKHNNNYTALQEKCDDLGGGGRWELGYEV